MKNIIHDFPLISNLNFNTSESDLSHIIRQSITDFFNDGAVILIDKAPGWTSFDVVNKIRHVTKAKKVGHCGTLDPFATGLLIVCTGKATKHVDSFVGLSKVYLNEFELGKITDTLDSDGEVIAENKIGEYSGDQLQKIALELTGEIEQVPPSYSAIKVNGVAAYKLARKGKLPELKPRKIRIDLFEIIDYKKPILKTRIHCSRGTYIRALARDFGQKLGCGAFVRNLRREFIGSYSCREALSIEQFREAITALKSLDVHSN